MLANAPSGLRLLQEETLVKTPARRHLACRQQRHPLAQGQLGRPVGGGSPSLATSRRGQASAAGCWGSAAAAAAAAAL